MPTALKKPWSAIPCCRRLFWHSIALALPLALLMPAKVSRARMPRMTTVTNNSRSVNPDAGKRYRCEIVNNKTTERMNDHAYRVPVAAAKW